MAAEASAPAVPEPAGSASRSDLLVAVGREALPSLFAALVAGFLIAGVGGRLAMFLLRVTSGSHVIGIESDDGFIIGRVTAASFGLIAALTAGAVIVMGPAYMVARRWVPSRWRVPVFAVVFGLLGGGALVHADGIDFTLLTPRPLAVGLFVLIPAAFAAVLEPLFELGRRLTARAPAWLFMVAALVSTVGVLIFGPPGWAIGAAIWLAWAAGYGSYLARLLRTPQWLWLGRIGLVAFAAIGTFELGRDLMALF